MRALLSGKCLPDIVERSLFDAFSAAGAEVKMRSGFRLINGGFPPYGYSLRDGFLEINEDEAQAIRTIFEQWVTTDIGANGLAKYMENHGIHKIARHNGKNPLFDASLIRRIIKNPVYCGKIAYGRRKTEKVHGTRNEYKLVEQDDYLLVDGLHEGIVSEEMWNQAQVKMITQAKKYEHVYKAKDTKTHLTFEFKSGIEIDITM